MTKSDREEIEGSRQRDIEEIEVDDQKENDIATKAAIRLQSTWRGHHDRDRVHGIVEKIFEKVFDKDSGKYFYFNTMTSTSHWEKPRLMKYHQEIDAATRIQSLWRGSLARSKFSAVVENIYEKSFDNTSGKYFYFNKLTNTSRWDRPEYLRR